MTEYSQLTHSGKASEVAATDGVSIYLCSNIGDIDIVAATGGEIEKFNKLPPRSFLLDVSPDGSTLLYLLYQSQVAATAPLYSLKVLGGSPRYLGSASDAQWSADGNSIWYDSNGDISHMNVDGTNAHRLISAAGPIEALAVSPDGKTLRYFKDDKLWEAASSGTRLHQLLRNWPGGQPGCCGAWSPDNSTFVFEARPKHQLWALDERNTLFHRPSEQPVPLTASPIDWGRPVFSKDGKRIFCTGSKRRGELIRFDSNTGQFQSFLGGISANLLSFSRDGRTVAYVAYPDRTVWKSNVDGTERLQLSDPSVRAEYLNISPDGTQVAFMAPSTDSNVRRSYVVSSQGGGARLLFPKGAGPETDPTWSPDGHRIAFGTNWIDDKTRPGQIQIVDVDTQQISAVTDSANKFSPRWSPDGRYLLASSLDISGLFVFDLKANHWTEIYKGISAYASWSHDGRFIYTLQYAGEPAVLRIPAKGGAPELIAHLKDVRFTGTFGLWLGLDPTDAPLLLRNEGTSDVYALNLQ